MTLGVTSADLVQGKIAQPAGGRDYSFEFEDAASSFDVLADSRIVVATADPAAGGMVPKVLKPDGTLDRSFRSREFGPRAPADGQVFPNGVFLYKVLSHPDRDGSILVSGSFRGYGGTKTSGVILLESDGSLRRNYQVGLAEAYALAFQADGKLLAGGSTVGACCARQHLERLNPDGSMDKTFSLTGTGLDSYPMAVAVQTGGKILVGGTFSSYNGTRTPYVARLNPDGSLDPAFQQSGQGLDGFVNAITLLPNGKILLGGDFHSYDGNPAQGVIRLNADGTRDASFQLVSNVDTERVLALTVSPDGRILVGGNFSANGQRTPGLIRLDADGRRDPGFVPALDGNGVVDVQQLRSGKVVVAGSSAFRQLHGGPVPGHPASPGDVRLVAHPRLAKVRWTPAYSATRYWVRVRFTGLSGKKQVKRVRVKESGDPGSYRRLRVPVRAKKKTDVVACVKAENTLGASGSVCEAKWVRKA